VHTSSGSSHVGAIAGGIVGGVCGLILLLLIAWFIARRRKHSEFDGDFDPGSTVGPVGRGGRQSLVPEGPNGAEVTPYVFQDRPRGPTLPQMGEYVPGSPVGIASGAALGAGVTRAQTSNPSENGYTQSESSYLPNPYPASSDRSDYAFGQGRQDVADHMPRSPTQATSSVYSQPSQPRTAKEREAYIQRFGASASGQRPLMLASGSEEESSVIVHQDMGRVPAAENAEGETEREIPPTYDSLVEDRRR